MSIILKSWYLFRNKHILFLYGASLILPQTESYSSSSQHYLATNAKMRGCAEYQEALFPRWAHSILAITTIRSVSGQLSRRDLRFPEHNPEEEGVPRESQRVGEYFLSLFGIHEVESKRLNC